MLRQSLVCLTILLLSAAPVALAQDLHILPDGVETRWVSFENPTAAPGAGGSENRGAKGHAFDMLEPGGSFVLADIEGAGIIQRMWLTVRQRSPQMLRAIKLEMFWDGADSPAVAAPLGDFFSMGLAEMVPFENALFSSPEGRSFNFVIPMPFRTGARVVITNEGDRTTEVFYDINYITVEELPDNALYFHTHWRRENPSRLGEAFEILPRIEGSGRFLGTNVGLITNPAYGDTWWGEGEIKVYLNGDDNLPTLVGTGTEDYIGTGWGQGTFINDYQGCTVADHETRHWAFYRYHVSDPVYFRSGIRVTLQQMGGAMLAQLRELVENGAKLQPISAAGPQAFVKLLELDPIPDLFDEDFPPGWVNYYREDDVSATAYFYLDQPENGLPPLPPVEVRTAGLAE